MANNKKFQILSLDGGGIKGIFSAAVLAYLEDDLQTKVIDHFDLIVGTSTGGIIALALGLGKTPKEIVEFYVKYGFLIFGKKRFNLLKNKYTQTPFKNALKDHSCLGNKLLGESQKRLVITSYNLGDDDVYLFKTAHHERLSRDYKIPAWKVGLATSAAPTFFPVCNEIDSIRHIDGGIWANNPSMIGLVEAISILNIPLDFISILSIGTTDEIVSRPKKLDFGGLWQWRDQAIKIALQGQSIGVNTQISLLLGEKKVVRLNPKVPDNLFALDKLSEKELISKAAHISRHYIPIIKEKFMNHPAEVFKPFYRT